MNTTQERRVSTLYVGVGAFVVVAFVTYLLASQLFGVSASIDYIQYFAGYRAALSGGNPYDPAVLLNFERLVGYTHELPMMLWVPPWTLYLLTPFVAIDSYSDSLLLWRSAAIVLYCVSLFLVIRTEGYKRAHWFALILVCVSGPFLHSIKVGQLTALLVLGVSLAIYYMRREAYVLSGAALMLLSVKPHLFIVSAFVVAFMLSSRIVLRMFLGAVVAMGGIVTLSYLQFPHLLSQWLTVTFQGGQGVVQRGEWVCGTLSCVLGAGQSIETRMVMSIALIVAAVCALLIFYRRRELQAHEIFAYSLPLSVLVSPYGWFFDFAVLTPSLIVGFERAREGVRAYSLAVVSIALSSLIVFLPVQMTHDSMWWYPLAAMGAYSLVPLTFTQKSAILTRN